MMPPNAIAPNPTPRVFIICNQPKPTPRARAGSDSAARVHTMAASALRNNRATNWHAVNVAAVGAAAVAAVATV